MCSIYILINNIDTIYGVTRVMESLSLTTGEIRYASFTAVSGKASLSGIRKGLGIHAVVTSRLSASLQSKGLIEVVKDGISKTVSIAESKHAQLFRKLVLEYRHIPFHRLLSGPSLEVLSAICNWNLGSRKEISQVSLVSEASVARSIEKLKRAGILQKRDYYIITPRFQTLQDFVLEYRHYVNQKAAQSFATDAVVVWEKNREFIVETSREEENKGFRLTGPSAFGMFGIPLMMPSSYYYSPSHKRLRLEDLIMHSLFLPTSERITLAVLLVWKKNEKSIRTSYLLEQAAKYDVKEKVKEIMEYLATDGKKISPGLPAWSEFASKAEEYRIKI